MGRPTGTVTFLFTDIEGSTRTWEHEPDAMAVALARHDELLRLTVAQHDGYFVKSTGDGVLAAFGDAHDALAAAVAAQLALVGERWPTRRAITVRMGLHSGTATLRDGDYYGSALNRAARLMAVGHGEQVLVSDVVRQLVTDPPRGVEFADLGEHRLRDLTEPLHVYQLVHPQLRRDFPTLRSGTAPGNLPLQRSSFVGREDDVARIERLLPERRLLTLTGVGGVGKTRLAVQAGAAVAAHYPGGVWLVELARVGDEESVPSITATAIGAVPTPGRDATGSVCDHLAATRSLLILDNCEHVIEAAAELVGTILDCCGNVTILATSREPLDIEGEQVIPVPPLDVGTEAVSLFTERATAVDPTFDLDTSAVEVAEICRRLDGVPLAIELAAARVDAMAPADLARLLDDHFRLLSSGRRRAVDRHQTLRTALDWSYRLLEPGEQVLLRRLGVFAGGFTAAAARVVCGCDDDVDADEGLASLVHRSLVQYERDRGRYRLLEIVRAYAFEQLAQADEADRFGRAHAEWMASLLDHTIEQWLTRGAVDRRAICGEMDNWREAVNFVVAAEDASLALALGRHQLGAEFPETATWTERMLEIPGVAEQRDARWLHYTLAIAAAAVMDADRVALHVAAFDALTVSDTERTYVAPPRASRAFVIGEDAVTVMETALTTPGLSDLQHAYLELFRGFYRNIPPRSDPEAALAALDHTLAADLVHPEVAHGFVALALRDTAPEAALEQLTRAEALSDPVHAPFEATTVMAWGSLVLASLPAPLAARHLLERLDRLQPHWNTSASVLLTVCVNLLDRVGAPGAAELHRFVTSMPGGGRIAMLLSGERTVAADGPGTLDEALALAHEALTPIADA